MTPRSEYNTLLKKAELLPVGLLLLIGALALIGFFMMYSAGGGNVSPWLAPQLIKFLPALIMMFALALMPPKLLLRYAYHFYVLCIIALITVELAGYIGGGAQRWVSIGFVSVQPSEFMKISVILALARYFHMMHPEDVVRARIMIPPLVLVLIPAALILKQPNLGTATILTAVGGWMFLMIGVRWRYFFFLIAGGLAAAPLAWHFLHDYQKRRIMTFLDPDQDPLGAGYNIIQSMIAIGSGGLFGKGYMQGSQGQLNFLPEKHTDFIFTMIAEEFGFIGSMLVLLIYAALMAYGMAVALRSRNVFGSMIAVGITALLFMHVFINIGMVMGILPVVGVPLPMLSYGGTMLVTMMLGFGLLLNAYINRDQELSRSTQDGL